MLSPQRPDLGILNPGDPVVITDPDRRQNRRTEGFVVKAARVWVTIADGIPDDGRAYRREWRMRRDTQTENTGFGHGGRRFATVEQDDWDQELADADRYLSEQGIALRGSSPWREPHRRRQLADLIRSAESSA